MWTDKFNLKELEPWLCRRTNRISTGNKDPYTSSMRSATRFISALKGSAESREAQLLTDLTSAQLYNRDRNEKSKLAKNVLDNCKLLSIPDTEELSIILVILMEGLRQHNDTYISIVRFWYSISKKVNLLALSNNISVSYLISYFSVKDNNTNYTPLDDIIDELEYIDLSSMDLSNLVDLQLTDTAKSGAGKLTETIMSYTTRSARKEMFQALNIMFSFDKQDVIDDICPPSSNMAFNKRLKDIIALYSGYFSFSNLLYSTDSANNQNKIINQSFQKIYYGAPGTGKSHKIKKQLEGVPKENIFRTTFHPDSDYSTFVGAYKPSRSMKPLYGLNGGLTIRLNDGKDLSEETITYKFIPQAFLSAYMQAYKKPDNVYLIIEEINRGNCAQIFGDLFQLLDRDESGVSEYTIKADADLRSFLEEELGEESDAIKDGELCLPSNLYIYATMNTSDQSLFPIDSAFKRRWDWEYEPIKYKNTDWSINIQDRKYSWVSFQRVINGRIFEANSSEDKMLGDYFVNPADGKITEKMLLNKILFYLWNDVCKDGEGEIFKVSDTEDISFSDLHGEGGQEKLIAMMEYLQIQKIE